MSILNLAAGLSTFVAPAIARVLLSVLLERKGLSGFSVPSTL